MKKYFTSSFATFTVVFFVALVLSCQNDSGLLPISETVVSGKYLEFDDKTNFDSTLKVLANKSRQDLDAWDKMNNFISLRNVYETIIDEESSNWTDEENMIKANSNLRTSLKHKQSTLLNQCKEMISYSENGVDLKLFDAGYAKLLNKDGIVKIGSSLYQFGINNFKEIVNADYAEVKKLGLINKNNQTKNIKYYDVFVTKNALKNSKTANQGDCSNDNNVYRLEASSVGYFYYFFSTAYGRWTYNCGAYVQSKHKRKSWYGSWVNNTTGIYRSYGQWKIIAYGIPENYLGLGIPITPNTPLASYDQTAYSGQASEARYYFLYYSNFVPYNEVVYSYADIFLKGTFNFEFYDRACTIDIQ